MSCCTNILTLDFALALILPPIRGHGMNIKSTYFSSYKYKSSCTCPPLVAPCAPRRGAWGHGLQIFLQVQVQILLHLPLPPKGGYKSSICMCTCKKRSTCMCTCKDLIAKLTNLRFDRFAPPEVEQSDINVRRERLVVATKIPMAIHFFTLQRH